MSQPEYSTINMNTFPGEMKLPGKTLVAQAENVDYQDIPRDIQIMRQEAYKKEVKEGEFVPEFSAWTKEFGAWTKEFGAWTKEFSGLNGLPISNGILGLIGLVGIAFAAYKFWPRKIVALRSKKAKRARRS